MSPLIQGPFTPQEEIHLRNHTYKILHVLKNAGNNLKGLLAQKEGVI